MSYVAQRLVTFPLIPVRGIGARFRLDPPDPWRCHHTAMLGTEAASSPVQRQALAVYFGIDQPMWSQYLHWAGGLFSGDLGISVTHGKPVLGVILDRFPLTLELALLSMVIALCVGVPRVCWRRRGVNGRAIWWCACSRCWGNRRRASSSGCC